MPTTIESQDQIRAWRRELARMVVELRADGLHLGICKDQVLELAATRCEWPSLSTFRDSCPRFVEAPPPASVATWS